MSTRSYVLEHGTPVSVEVTPDTSIAQVEAEVQRLYGPAFHVRRWGRRGNRWRGEVFRGNLNDSDIIRAARKAKVGRGWFEVAP